MLLDLRLPDGDGALLLEELALRRGAPPTIVVTAYGSGSRAIAAMRAGAFDYVQKPLDPGALVETLRAAIARGRRTGARTFASGTRSDGERIVGSGPAMQRVFKLVGRVAASDATVLLLGETGTGKELVARAIHDCSPRASGPFVAVNCAAIPEPLLEGELFGHEKGAFTGAVAARPGRFEARARRHAVPRRDRRAAARDAGQAAARAAGALRRAARRQQARRVDVRIVAATNRDLHRGRRRAAASARTCSTASTWSRSSCRRCASGATTSRRSSTHFAGASPRGATAAATSIAPAAVAALRAYRGPATCASWRTRSSARWC